MKERLWLYLQMYAIASHLASFSIALAVPSARVVGPVEIVYDWQKHHCPDGLYPWQWDVPDGPPRMFRNSNETWLIAGSNLGSRANIGIDANHIKHTCYVYSNNSCGNQDPRFARQCPAKHCCDPSLYQSREWIQSPVSFPENNTVFGLTHMEFHANNESRALFGVGCDSSGDVSCWYNAIVAHVSHDGGRTWGYLRPPPEHLVASVPYRVPNKGGPYTIGYEAPSNILLSPKDGFYYVLVQTWNYRAQRSNASQWPGHAPRDNRSGSCVLRTRDLFDPRSWRGWNGASWDTVFIDPYEKLEFDPAEHVCAPVVNIGYPSLVWSSYYEKFMIAGNQYWDCSDVVFALSDDLVSWSDTVVLRSMNCTTGFSSRRKIYPTPLHPDFLESHATIGASPFYREIYPSLLDPDSPSPSHDIVGASPYLYFVTFHDNQVHEGFPVVVRGISRQKIQFAKSAGIVI